MGYYPYKSLPIFHALADKFVICDRWFSSIKGPTWPNRNFAIAGTTEKVTMPDDTDYSHYSQIETKARNFIKPFLDAEKLADYKFTSPTVFHRLYEKDIPFKVYYHDVPSTLRKPRSLSCWLSLGILQLIYSAHQGFASS